MDDGEVLFFDMGLVIDRRFAIAELDDFKLQVWVLLL
jgi:hypothetical protein